MQQRDRTIYLIDDHKVLTDGIQLILNGEGYEHIVAINNPENIEMLVDKLADDIVILDININGTYGIDVLKAINKKHKGVDVIILSSYRDAYIIKSALQNGCKAFLTKQLASDHILLALDGINQGQTYYDPLVQEIINTSFMGNSLDDLKDREKKMFSMLTKREIEVLKLIANEFSSEEIAKELFISKGTVDSHRKNLIQKLQVKNSVGLGVFAKANNLI